MLRTVEGVAVSALQDEATELLQRLVRLDTSNPPGHETAAALVLRDYLEAHGVGCELVARDPERANLIARLPGDGSEPSLALLGHLDVVPADATGWTRPPFSGHLDADGFVWGRGTADMKNELATRAVVLAALAREGFRPRGDLLLVAAADEEDGTNDVGASWLVRERPDLRVDYVLNEGAAERLDLANGRRLVTIAVGEKSAAIVRVTALGTPAATTLAKGGVGAVVRLARLIERLDGFRAPATLVPQTRRLIELLAGPLPNDPDSDQLDATLADIAALHPAMTDLVLPLVVTTIAPTRLQGSNALNVVPARASVDCDCRLPPGVTGADLLATFADALGDDIPHELQLTYEVTGGTVSPADSPFIDVVTDILADVDPEAVLVPTLLNGFTDSHYFRSAFGSQAYGFWPVRHTPYDVVATGVHGNDERIHVDDLGYAIEFELRLCRELLGPPREPTHES
jgi:acetylornithine deacetylase/succinyl-diaminopimelate desuccinylase-like protein